MCEHVHLPLRRAPPASSRRCEGRTRGRGTSRSSSASARPFPTSRSEPTSSWGSRARRSATSSTRSRWWRRSVSTARSRWCPRLAAGTEAAAMPDQVPGGRSSGADGATRRPSSSAARPPGTPNASADWRRSSSKGRAAPIRRCSRGRTRRNTTVNFTGTAAAGDLARVRIEGSTSTTLRGREAALVAA